MNNLFKIRKIVPILSPLYISICAALLVELKSNLKLDCASFLYCIGLICFFIACYISNKLNTRCNNSESIYMIEINDHARGDQTDTKPTREKIYEKCENNIKRKRFQYFGFWFFGILGLVCVCFSYFSSEIILE